MIYLGSISLGVMYHGPPDSKEEDWIKAFKLIKNYGLNIVKIWTFWSYLEPRPNHYDFSEFDKLLEVANHYDLSVVLNTVIESQPFWIHRLFPQAYMIDQYGSPILSTTGEYSSGLSPGTCLDHLGPRVQAEKFLTSIANHFKDEENLLCWDAWNEFRWFDNIYDMSRGESIEHSRIPCYCDKTIEKFRIWLKNKYDSLVGLNERWRRTYIDWVDVFPPRGGWFSYAYPEMVDWRNFIIEYVIDKLEFRVNAIRKGDSLHPIMTHSMNSSIRNPEILCYAGSDDWKNSRVVDLYGTSFYPSWDQSGGTDLDQNFLCLDGLRCASGDKEFWIAELQGGPSFHSPGKATNYYPQDIHFWTYSALSHGAKGILYWSWDPEPLGPEALGFGLTLIDGTPTPRAKMVKNLSQIIERNKSLFARSKPVSSKVAILFDPDLFIINCFGGSGGMKRDMVNNSVRGYYRAFWENNISCDFIHSNYLSKIKNYKLLILPFVFCLKLKTAHVIKDYIRNGGIVVSEAYFGRFKEGFLPAETSPPYGLQDVFKIKEKEVEFINSTKILPDRDEEIFRGIDSLTGHYFKEELDLFEDAETIGRYEDFTPAIIRSKYGLGETISFASLLGLNWWKDENNNLKRFIHNISQYAGICTQIETIPSKESSIITRIHTCGDKQYLIFCQNWGVCCDVKLKIHLPKPKVIRDLLSNSNLRFSVKEHYSEVSIRIDHKDTKIFIYKY